MFSSFGKIKYTSSKSNVKIKIQDLIEGINSFEDFIIYKNNQNLKVFDRKCDHAGGKIISKNNKHICPIHNWEFNPIKGEYLNCIKKKQCNYKIKNKVLVIEKEKLVPKIKNLSEKETHINIRFFNHAFLIIKGKNYSFATDPWAYGPAFNTGWWLKNNTKKDWEKKLNEVNFIYVSHNHPDHLHPLTLSKVDKEKTIIVPNFITDSTGKYCESLGFKKVIRLNFEEQYNLNNTNLVLSILKSGDFREDSGIYFSDNKFTGLLDVDSNIINFEKFPKVDLYASSFAGGASGYPLMFENYKDADKQKILIKQKNFTKIKKINNLKMIEPKFFLPYAGFFKEKLDRDKNIFKQNKKNSILDYADFCSKNNIKLLNVENEDTFIFENNILKNSKNVRIKKYNDLSENEYLKYYKNEFNKFDNNYIKNYFINSKYKDNLILYLVITDDDFKKVGNIYKVDFSNNNIKFTFLRSFNKNILKKKNKKKILVLKIRKESFLNTIYNKLPWEDLSIGFQCKVYRNPNEYNAKFWHFFTNIYITDINIRLISDCNSCNILANYIDDKIYNKS